MYRTILQGERWFGPNYGKKQTACGCKVNVGVPDRLSHLPLLWQMGHQPDTMQCLQNMNATTFSKSHWRECPLLPATVAPPRPQPVYKLYNCQGQCLGCLMVSPTLTNEVCLCSLVRFSNHYFCWSIGEPVLPPLQPARFSNWLEVVWRTWSLPEAQQSDLATKYQFCLFCSISLSLSQDCR